MIAGIGLALADAALCSCAEFSNPVFGSPRYDGFFADPADRWNRRYQRVYSYVDDAYYRDCRDGLDPAGILAGAVIGGLTGSIAVRGEGRAAATIGGVILGGAVGAELTNDLACEDRSYAYRSYYEGLNSGRPNLPYRWRNPHTGNSGEFQVREYYSDPDDFLCANFIQQIFANNRPQTATGRACRQPDGSWVIVG
jgi:surface antigen